MNIGLLLEPTIVLYTICMVLYTWYIYSKNFPYTHTLDNTLNEWALWIALLIIGVIYDLPKNSILFIPVSFALISVILKTIFSNNISEKCFNNLSNNDIRYIVYNPLSNKEIKEVREHVHNREIEIIRRGLRKKRFLPFEEYNNFFYESSKDIINSVKITDNMSSEEKVKTVVEAYNKILDNMEAKIDK